MQRVNDQYDWRRPPTGVVQATIDRVYSGQATSQSYGYLYKKSIRVSELQAVWEIWLHTPSGIAAMAAQEHRSSFQSKPTLDQVRARDVLAVVVLSQGTEKEDLPMVAVARNGTLTRPAQEYHVHEAAVPCANYYGLHCLHITRLFYFNFTGDNRVSGIAELVLRWDDAEKRVPFSFDYLW